MIRTLRSFFVVIACYVGSSFLAWGKDDIQARYYPGIPAVGQSFYVAVSWSIPQGWHMEAPSEYMPMFRWNLPEGLSFSRWYWPVAQPFSSPAVGGQSLGYSKRVMALAEFKVSQGFSVEGIKADVKWALCQDTCVLYDALLEVREPLTELQWLDAEELLRQDKSKQWPVIPFVFAWLGGLILNVMPCVLPVLSLKVIDFLSYSTYPSWLRGLAFTGGVSSGFLALGGVILLLKETGAHALGWGFHMQSPYFVGIMMILFLLIGFNMWGLVEVGTSFTRLSLPTWLKHPLLKAWGVGLVTCGVSTPCTAPFMGTAIAYGLTSSSIQLLGILLTLGLGLSTPVLLLTVFPSWMRWLPKPGQWMLAFKKVLSVGFFITACWLAWVLGTLTWGDVARVDIQNVEQILASDQAVLLDFTADWCVTCQANKQVLYDDEVQKALKEKKITIITIDLTQHSPDGVRLLSRFQRSAIPLVVYSKGRNQYSILPPLLARGDILGLLN